MTMHGLSIILLAKDLSGAIGIFSSMLTPAVLIMATSSMILATSNRLNRLIERTRKLFDQHRINHSKTGISEEEILDERRALDRLLIYQIRRVKNLQRTMVTLYLALCLFVTTSICIGILEIAVVQNAWLPLVIGMTGAGFLFYSTLLLLAESRIAWFSVHFELRYISRTIRKS